MYKGHTSQETGRAGWNFVITNRGTNKPCCNLNEYSGTASSRSPARTLCPTAAGDTATANGDLRWPLFVSYAKLHPRLPSQLYSIPRTQYHFNVKHIYSLMNTYMILIFILPKHNYIPFPSSYISNSPIRQCSW